MKKKKLLSSLLVMIGLLVPLAAEAKPLSKTEYLPFKEVQSTMSGMDVQSALGFWNIPFVGSKIKIKYTLKFDLAPDKARRAAPKVQSVRIVGTNQLMIGNGVTVAPTEKLSPLIQKCSVFIPKKEIGDGKCTIVRAEFLFTLSQGLVTPVGTLGRVASTDGSYQVEISPTLYSRAPVLTLDADALR